ncbi:transmembrane receptor [Apiospora rasikravindrae]|uniref:Transmembrane receptor n=1 Tax=Apiospora rasikravindrae TaxID=990691 RepID=A0ABR1S1Y1_9PEZI
MSTTHINHFSLRRSCIRGILATSLVLLLSASSSPSVFVARATDVDNKIDQGSTSPPPPPPGVSTSEVLEIGPPSTTHEKSTVTRTVTLTVAYKPTLAPGDSTYSLLGCYGHTGFEGVHPFGKERDYASPPLLDAKNVSVAACLDGCAKLPSPNKTAAQFAYVGLKNGSECYCAVNLSPEATKLSGDNCTSACPGSPRLSCGGKDAIAIYSLASGSQKSSSSTTTRLPPTSESLTTSPYKTPQVGIGAHSPSPAPASSHPVFDGQKNGGGDGPPAPASTTTVAAISGSMSGAIILGALFFFCFRRYKKRRVEQDARVAAMVIAQKAGRKVDDDDDKGHHYERSPSRGRRRTREYHRPPSLIVSGDAFREDRDARLTTDGVLVPTTPALESGGKDPAGFYYHTNNNIMMGGEQQQQPERDSLFSVLLGQVSVPVGPRTPSAIGSSSAVQWRRTTDMAAAATHSVPVSPMTKPPDSVAVLPGSLGERAWHRRRISTPYAPPPTIPLPPTPPNKKKRLAAAAAAAIGELGRGGPEGSDRQSPQRPLRRESAATFEATPRTPGATSSIPESYRDKTLEYDGDDEEGGMKPLPPLKTRVSQQPPNNNHGMMGGMVYMDHHEGRQPTIPSLPPITPGEEFELDSPYWRSLAGMRRNTGGDDDRSPRSATTVGTSILMESPTLPWETDPTRRTAEHEKRQ